MTEHSPLYRVVTEALADALETKEGRVLSSKNRKMIADCINQMKESIAALDALLEATNRDEDSE